MGGYYGCLNLDSTGDEVASELMNMLSIDSVSVTRVESASAVTYSVTFTGDLVRGNVDALSIDDIGVNGCTAVANEVPTGTNLNGVRRSMLPVYRLETTGALPYNVGAQEMKDALEGLDRVARVDVSKSVENNGFAWQVTFRGENSRSSTDMPMMLVNSVNVDAAIGGATTAASLTEHYITGLSSGVTNYFSVSGVNAYGAGPSTVSTPTAKQAVDQTPGVVENLRAYVGADRHINVQFDAPKNHGGQAISHYRVQYDTYATFDYNNNFTPFKDVLVKSQHTRKRGDVQMVTVVSEQNYFPSGTFVLGFLGQNTHEIDYNVSSTGMKSALESLSTVQQVDVSRELFCTNEAGVNNCGPHDRGYVWMITFVEIIDNGLQTEPYMTSYDTNYNQRLSVTGDFLQACDGDNVNIGDSVSPGKWDNCYSDGKTVAFVDSYPETQNLCLCDASTTTITYMGQTKSMAINPDNTAVKTALESITGVGHVSVGAGAAQGGGSCNCGGSNAATIYGVTFNTYVGDAPLVGVSSGAGGT